MRNSIVQFAAVLFLLLSSGCGMFPDTVDQDEGTPIQLIRDEPHSELSEVDRTAIDGAESVIVQSLDPSSLAQPPTQTQSPQNTVDQGGVSANVSDLDESIRTLIQHTDDPELKRLLVDQLLASRGSPPSGSPPSGSPPSGSPPIGQNQNLALPSDTHRETLRPSHQNSSHQNSSHPSTFRTNVAGDTQEFPHARGSMPLGSRSNHSVGMDTDPYSTTQPPGSGDSRLQNMLSHRSTPDVNRYERGNANAVYANDMNNQAVHPRDARSGEMNSYRHQQQRLRDQLVAEQLQAWISNSTQLPFGTPSLDGSGNDSFNFPGLQTGGFDSSLSDFGSLELSSHDLIGTTTPSIGNTYADALTTNQGSFPAMGPMRIAPGQWKEHILDTIHALEQNRYLRAGEISESERIRNELTLRFLYLLIDDRDRALQPIEQLGGAEQSYWNEQLFVISELLSANTLDLETSYFSSNGRRNAVGAQHLRQALGHLSDIAMLQVRNVHLCRAINGYGSFETFDSATFDPGQEVLIYCELENLTARESAGPNFQVYESELHASVEILDNQKNVVQAHDYETVRDSGRNRRADFYVHFGWKIPTDLSDGDYYLYIIVEDRLGRKTATSAAPVHFRIRR